MLPTRRPSHRPAWTGLLSTAALMTTVLIGGPAPAHAQQAPGVVWVPAGPVAPAATVRYVTPATVPYVAPRGTRVASPAVASGTVLNGFDRRGGIGTTPFLGNTRGAGSYQVNYDAPRAGRRRGRLFGR